MELSDVQLRAVKDSDLNLILTSWLKGARYGSWMREIDQDEYYRLYPQVIKDILRRCGLNVTIACWSDAPDVVLGWVALESEATIAHFAYVKPEYRNKGVFGLMIDQKQITHVTHVTKAGIAISRKKGWKFSPFRA